MGPTTHRIAALASIAALALGGASIAQARQGSDDGAGHVRHAHAKQHRHHSRSHAAHHRRADDRGRDAQPHA